MQKGTESQKFWAVWRRHGGGAPNKRHGSKDEAIAEAARLAQQTNEPYYVLEVVGVVAPVKPVVDYADVT